ncbi:unnamed protein product, partial [Meganyctiphanes norvegica]
TVSGTSQGSLPNELIAQILLARANAAKRLTESNKSPVPVYSHTAASEKNNQQELYEESDYASTAQVDPLAAFVSAEACHGKDCGDEDFKARWSMPLIKLGQKSYYL